MEATLELLQLQVPELPERKFKKDNLFCCPSCGSEELIQIQSEIFCDCCEWDNCQRLVNFGELDALIYAAESALEKPLYMLPTFKREAELYEIYKEASHF